MAVVQTLPQIGLRDGRLLLLQNRLVVLFLVLQLLSVHLLHLVEQASRVFLIEFPQLLHDPAHVILVP